MLVGEVSEDADGVHVGAYTLTREQWCEAIASVTPPGVTAATLLAAQRFHGVGK